MIDMREFPTLRTVLFLIGMGFAVLPGRALYGGTAASAETSTYVFLADQSTVVQTGGFAGVHWTYSVEGQFQLTVDRDAGTASFAHVDANAADDTPLRRTVDLNDVFNLTSLVGTVLDEATIQFTGQASDASEVRIAATFSDDTVVLKGATTPPPNSADFFVFALDAVAQRKYAGGTGEPNDPYLIYTAEQMNAIGSEPNDWDKHFRLVMDIDLAGPADSWFCLIGSEAHPFRGTFDGNGHTISGFTYVVEVNEPNRPWIGESQIGLFRYVEAPGEIRGLGLIDPNVRSAQTCTGLVQSVGALVGELHSGSIADCHVVRGLVSAYSAVGGLVGRNVIGTISDCHATCRIAYRAGRALDSPWPMRPPSMAAGFGGLVGHNGGGIYNSYATGSVQGAYMAGGLVGTNDGRAPLGIIRNCLATGDVSGKEQIGGLVGQNRDSIIQNSYAAGRVSGDEYAGGLVGANYDGVVTGSFWDLQTSGQATSAAGEGKTTAEMQTPDTFLEAGWDFVGETANGTEDIWWIDEGNDYPRFWWEGVPVLIVDDFESYTDEPGNRIFDIWIDGWDIPENGAVVGCDWPGDWQCPGIVHGGQQAMPMRYDNSGPASYSEAVRTWATPRDWTIGDADALALYFRGEVGNGREPLCVGIQDNAGRTAVMVHPDTEAVLATEWQKWQIALADVPAAGVDVATVKKMVIGVGDRNYPRSGEAGRIYIDDIRLTKPMP